MAGSLPISLSRAASFYIAEFHPFMSVFDNSRVHRTEETSPISTAGTIRWIQGDYADPNAVTTHPSYEWTHSLGDILNALIGAGLRIDFVHEFPLSCYKWRIRQAGWKWLVASRGRPRSPAVLTEATKPRGRSVDRSFRDNLRLTYDRSSYRDAALVQDWKCRARRLPRPTAKGEQRALLEIARAGSGWQFFQDHGLEVTCIDLSPEMVRLCREKGLNACVMDAPSWTSAGVVRRCVRHEQPAAPGQGRAARECFRRSALR